jgi:nitrite reductase/ring-hydroxylating ferredoxin subunit/uncharacterized membrane protein
MAFRTALDRVETASGLDRFGNSLQRGVRRLIRGGTQDALHGVWLGHPLHPALVLIPAGSWLGAAVLDVLGDENRAAEVLVGVGTASAVPAAVTGINDWASLPREQRRVGLLHLTGNVLAVGLYAASFVARRRGRHDIGRALGYAGLTVVNFAAYVGGHLTYRGGASTNQAEPLLREIPEGWHDVCSEQELSLGGPLVAQIGEVPVLVAPGGDGNVTVMIERCGHETGPLSRGEYTRIDGADCVICPWCGSTFRLSDGAAVHGPAATSQPLLRTQIVAGRVQAALP